MTSAAERALGDDTLVFLHLPKTGGTALRTSLLEAFDPSATALIYPGGELDGGMTVEHFRGLPEDQRTRMRLVIGHVRFGIHESIPGPSQYTILLRDPVDRIVSLYYHYRNLPGVRFMSKGYRERIRLRVRRVMLDDWVFGERRIPADNLMVRNVAGAAGIPFGGCTETLFEQAMEHVERDFVGIAVTEDLARSTALMEQVLDRPLPVVGRENTNPNRPLLSDIDPSVAARLRELNEYDVRFYEQAKARLELSSR